MKEISKLLIAYDGSTCSDAALEDLKRAGLPEQLEAVVMTVAALIFLPPDEQLTDDEVVSPGAATMVSASSTRGQRSAETRRRQSRSREPIVSKKTFPAGR